MNFQSRGLILTDNYYVIVFNLRQIVIEEAIFSQS